MSESPSIVAEPSRTPRQGRSRASFERMMQSAEELLRERGNDDFTLTEVSRRGKVSIGSIYCRFDSKDDLIRAVHARALDETGALEAEVLRRAAERGLEGFDSLIMAMVDEMAEMLKHQAPLLRPMMARAGSDPAVATSGKEAYNRFIEGATATLLAHRDEITHPDPQHAVGACLNMIYAVLARYLGLGSSITALGQEADWPQLKRDLGEMATLFLTAPREKVKAKTRPVAAKRG